jgi:hypothetical protein
VTLPHGAHDPDERDTDMTATYIRVVIVEAAIIVALWILGRAFV